MSTKHDKTGPGRPKGRKPTELIQARVPPPLAKRFNEVVESIRPATSVTAVITMLIEDWLKDSDEEPSDV